MGPLEPSLLAAFAVPMLLLAYLAWRLGFLDGGGTVVSLAIGFLMLVAVGPAWIVLLLAFAVVAFLATRLGRRRKRALLGRARSDERRGWRNVIGNGGTAGFVAGLGLVVAPERLAVPFAVAVAVAAADTIASEIGSLSDRAVLISRPGRRVPAGMDGGVSLLGTSAAAVAALGVGALAHFALGLPLGTVPFVAVFGFAGSLLDSVLGALWEASPATPGRQLSKTQVNLISVSVPTVVAAVVLFVA